MIRDDELLRFMLPTKLDLCGKCIVLLFMIFQLKRFQLQRKLHLNISTQLHLKITQHKWIKFVPNIIGNL